ncbi:putative peptidyl-tRNA hydrolase PTRHD1 [Pseudolycoriella hygida]|uniref:peptidyl-tRNA hydrolase n=1 Tax=Pseudolycoriella hygida TaxID=35572 RepID=A0A9Q0RX60_9DIPT|nr:putative peptidyl-tRNA hydrolase PTRHD1 [Pseudolycoriella hygida]
MERIVQYVIVRGDLSKSLQWPLGAIIAQCCHATTAICNETINDVETKEYFNDIDNMHKVVLEANDDKTLNSLSETLKEKGIIHKLWIEQPESIPTCIAIKPYQKKHVHPFVKHLKLLK